MNEMKIEEKSHIKEMKAQNDNFTNTLYKRPFSIEKIKKDLNRIKNYNSRTSNNQDKHLLELRKKLKEKVMKEYSSNEKMPLSKNLDNLYRFIKKINNNNLNIKSIKSRGGIISSKKKFNRQRSDFDLPMISSSIISAEACEIAQPSPTYPPSVIIPSSSTCNSNTILSPQDGLTPFIVKLGFSILCLCIGLRLCSVSISL